jgi:hypothetical protein
VCGTYQLQRHVAINVLNKAFLTTMSLQLNYMLYGTCTVGNSAVLTLDENYYKIKRTFRAIHKYLSCKLL